MPREVTCFGLKTVCTKLCRGHALELDRSVIKLSGMFLQTLFLARFIPLHARTAAGVPRTGRLPGSGNSNVERTFSLPSNPTPPGSFLLPSYPLATLPGVQLTPTLSRRCHADSTLSMSNTWPNNRELSPRHREPSPWRNNNGKNVLETLGQILAQL